MFLQLLVDQSAKTLEAIEELQRFVENGNQRRGAARQADREGRPMSCAGS